MQLQTLTILTQPVQWRERERKKKLFKYRSPWSEACLTLKLARKFSNQFTQGWLATFSTRSFMPTNDNLLEKKTFSHASLACAISRHPRLSDQCVTPTQHRAPWGIEATLANNWHFYVRYAIYLPDRNREKNIYATKGTLNKQSGNSETEYQSFCYWTGRYLLAWTDVGVVVPSCIIF